MVQLQLRPTSIQNHRRASLRTPRLSPSIADTSRDRRLRASNRDRDKGVVSATRRDIERSRQPHQPPCNGPCARPERGSLQRRETLQQILRAPGITQKDRLVVPELRPGTLAAAAICKSSRRAPVPRPMETVGSETGFSLARFSGRSAQAILKLPTRQALPVHREAVWAGNSAMPPWNPTAANAPGRLPRFQPLYSRLPGIRYPIAIQSPCRSSTGCVV